MSRASWLATVAGSFVVIFPRLRRNLLRFLERWRIKPVLIISIVIVFICVALIGMYYLKKDSADGRALMWKISLQVIPKHPLGVGLGNFPGTYASQQAVYFSSDQSSEQEELVAGSPEYGFNEYLQICIEWGIAPFLLFLAIIAGSIYIACNRKLWLWLAPLISLLVFAGMSYPFNVLPFAIVLVFLIAAIQSSYQGRKAKPCLTGIVIAISCLITACCLYNRYPVYEAYKKWNLSQMLYQTKAYKPAKKEYDTLYPYLNDQVHFLFEYGHILSFTNDYEKSNQILRQASRVSGDPMIYNVMGKNYQALKEYRQAEDCFIHAAQIVPHRLYPWYLLCKLYAEMGLLEKAAETAEIVLTKEPKVQSLAVKEMREEVKELRVKS
jgi:tetratricopeptide (TPR) repeat protein